MHTTCSTNCTNCTTRSRTLFQGIPESVLAELETNKRTLTFKKGESIFHSGDSAGHFYCISSGNVLLFRSSTSRQQSFEIAREGEWVGHRDALVGGEFEQSARALTNVTICRIPRENLDKIATKHPAFGLALSRNLAKGWARAEHQSYNLGARKTVERLADFLLEHRVGDTLEKVVEFPYTRETLGTLLGTTTEGTIRMMSDFRSRGWIDFSKDKIMLTNEVELERLVAES